VRDPGALQTGLGSQNKQRRALAVNWPVGQLTARRFRGSGANG
jgi:hypothetical protein